MSNATATLHFSMLRALVEQRINSISYPPSQEEALLYGHGFGDSFEVDYASVERVIMTELRAHFALNSPGLSKSSVNPLQPPSWNRSTATTVAALDVAEAQPNSLALCTPSAPPTCTSVLTNPSVSHMNPDMAPTHIMNDPPTNIVSKASAMGNMHNV
ncbi:hypothetical protein HWV62_24470 [Athelia sp. TMB]|nr:hypothetical protein HWV62_24470 [Athelia sp. TMB]